MATNPKKISLNNYFCTLTTSMSSMLLNSKLMTIYTSLSSFLVGGWTTHLKNMLVIFELPPARKLSSEIPKGNTFIFHPSNPFCDTFLAILQKTCDFCSKMIRLSDLLPRKNDLPWFTLPETNSSPLKIMEDEISFWDTLFSGANC